MPEEERMTIEERYKYMRRQRKRYQEADRVGKGRLLSEMEAVTGLQRKSLIRRLAREPRRGQRARQRGVTYDEAVRQAVLAIAESLDWVCAERLTPSLAGMAELLIEQGELELGSATLAQLSQISISTVRRILASLPKERWRLPRGAPRPNPIAKEIRVERIAWDIAEPGHVEMDLVHHSGRSGQGQYLHTLQAIDVATGWSERTVVVGRSYLAMAEAVRQIIAQLPFALHEVHFDNGPGVPQLPLDPLLERRATASYATAQPSLAQERQPLRRTEELHPRARLCRLRPPRLPRPGPPLGPDL